MAVDCNDSGTLDECDIADGTSLDTDTNCIPDECDQNPIPLAEPGPLAKSRFLSFVPVGAGCNVAIRVKLVSLAPPGRSADFAGSEGEVRWVGPSETVLEVQALGELFAAAQVQCDPHFENWAPLGVLHVYGGSIMPDSVYEVQFFDGDCGDTDNPACFSDPLEIATAHWGDVIAPFEGDGSPQPDFRDVADLVKKFSEVGGPPRAAAELDPNVIVLQGLWIDFKDIAAAGQSFIGAPYNLAGPLVCP